MKKNRLDKWHEMYVKIRYFGLDNDIDAETIELALYQSCAIFDALKGDLEVTLIAKPDGEQT